MLVLTRKIGESIAIGDDVKVTVMQIKGKQVRIGIKASRATEIHREEVYRRINMNKVFASPSFNCPPEEIQTEKGKDS